MADDQQTPMEIDLTEVAQDEAAAAAPLSPLPLNLLATIKTAQAQNGLRHGDYMRYRKHCTSRLQSLYKVLKMQHGRTKYQKRKLDVHNITDVRHLQVVMFNSERAWAQAMEIKKEAEASGSGGAIEPRKRHHLIGRLAKAVLWASELSRLAGARSDTRGCLEAEAYSCWLGGALLLERETDWETALGKFSRAKKLWQELAKACPDVEGQSLCLAQVEEVEPNIRYCNYRIDRAGGAVPADASELLAGGGEGGAGGDLLQFKLAALAAEAQQAAAASTFYLEWLGSRHPVRHEKVKLALHQANELGAAADKMMDADGDALDARLALYDKAVNALSDAKSHVRNAVKGLAGPDAETHFRELESLEAAVEGVRLSRALQRTEVALAGVRTRFGAGLSRLAAGKKIKDKERHARPEEVLRGLEVLGRHLEDLAELGARLGGRAGEELHDAAMARLSAARALRTYHVAHILLATAITNAAKTTTPAAPGSTTALEAWALFDRVQERAAAAAAGLRSLPAGDAAAVLLGPREALCMDLEEVGRQAAAYKAVAQAELFSGQLKAREDLPAGLTSLSINPNAALTTTATTTAAPYLLDALDTWESYAGGATTTAPAAAATGAAPTAAGGSKASPRLYKGPYPFAAIPMRPTMLDTASFAVAYPSVEHKLRKAERKSVLSSLFGWRR